jgi:hypothetical protein
MNYVKMKSHTKDTHVTIIQLLPFIFYMQPDKGFPGPKYLTC